MFGGRQDCWFSSRAVRKDVVSLTDIHGPLSFYQEEERGELD